MNNKRIRRSQEYCAKLPHVFHQRGQLTVHGGREKVEREPKKIVTSPSQASRFTRPFPNRHRGEDKIGYQRRRGW